jgi:hypothetical protein
MRFTYPYQYTSVFQPLTPKGNIDYRCKPARYVSTSRLFIDIPEVSGEQAPVAIRQQTRELYATDKVIRETGAWGKEYELDYRPFTVEYRWYDGRLWTTVDVDDLDSRHHDSSYGLKHLEIPDLNRPGYRGDYYHQFGECSYQTKAERVEAITKRFAQWLVIDGRLHKEHGEPRYEIITQGLGCDHGGTTLRVAYFYNGNCNWRQYFSLLKYDDAVAAWKSIADGRGDVKHRWLPEDRFEVLVPEAIKLDPAAWGGEGDEFCPVGRYGRLTNLRDPTTAGLGMLVGLAGELAKR